MTDPQPAIVASARAAREWWRGATIYQIYPRSFADSNGDGIGDLPGITAKLDHIAGLGVDAIWISPFFTSPMKDFGYDVADYRDVDPIFGTLADFDALVERAHALGLRVIIDQVYSHTSDQHPWFAESRQDRTNAKADWYVWADAKPEGSPPSNWASVFGGPAWAWDARRGQYYLHNFLTEQPDLNVHNPDVQEALLDTARFWLDRGVDGFRLDALNFTMHDPALRDNPPAPDDGGVRTRPFDFQLHLYNQSHADIGGFIERLRALLDTYGDRFTVAEIGGADPDPEMKAFTRGSKRLNSAYSFDFLYAPKLTPALVKASLERWPDGDGIGWPSWAFSNHDAPRAISRWAGDGDPQRYARMAMLLLASLRGNIFLYQGDELGLTQVDVAFEDLQDPEAIANWPLTLSRDGARTPMPWNGGGNASAGFSTAKPWLPLGPEHGGLAVDRQQGRADSMLELTRRLIALRNASDTLLIGTMRVLDADEALLVLERTYNGETLICAFNLADAALEWAPAQPDRWREWVVVNEARIGHLPPFSGLIAQRLG